MDDFTKILLTAAGTLVVGIVAALVGAWIQSRREHNTWLRAERMMRYVAYSTALDGIRLAGLQGDLPLMNDQINDSRLAGISLFLLGPEAVIDALGECSNAAHDFAHEISNKGHLAALLTAQSAFIKEASRALKTMPEAELKRIWAPIVS